MTVVLSPYAPETAYDESTNNALYLMRKTKILAKRKTPARKITHTQDPLHEDPCEDPFKVPCLTDDPCENVVEYPYKLTPVKRKDEQGHNNKMISEERTNLKNLIAHPSFLR